MAAEKGHNKGGKRPGSGRKKIGETRRVAITLPEQLWQRIDEIAEQDNKKIGEIFREFAQDKFDRG